MCLSHSNYLAKHNLQSWDPITERLQQEDLEVEANLGYTVRLHEKRREIETARMRKKRREMEGGRRGDIRACGPPGRSR